MTDKRNYHLSFCRICKNRSFKLKDGITCSLTDELAKFENNCEFFEKDHPKFDQIVIDVKDKLKNKGLKNKSFYDFLANKSGYETISDNQNEFNFSKKFFRFLLFAIIFGMIYQFFFKTENLDFKNIIEERLQYLIITSLMLIVIIYLNFIKKYKPVLIFEDEYFIYNRPILGESDINNCKIYWNEIIALESKYTPAKYWSSTKIIIGLISGKLIEIDIVGTVNNPIDIFELMKLKSKNIA